MATDPSAGPSPLDVTWQGFVFALAIVSAVLFWVYWHRRKL